MPPFQEVLHVDLDELTALGEALPPELRTKLRRIQLEVAHRYPRGV